MCSSPWTGVSDFGVLVRLQLSLCPPKLFYAGACHLLETALCCSRLDGHPLPPDDCSKQGQCRLIQHSHSTCHWATLTFSVTKRHPLHLSTQLTIQESRIVLSYFPSLTTLLQLKAHPHLSVLENSPLPTRAHLPAHHGSLRPSTGFFGEVNVGICECEHERASNWRTFLDDLALPYLSDCLRFPSLAISEHLVTPCTPWAPPLRQSPASVSMDGSSAPCSVCLVLIFSFWR